jgi:hypothetical protein
VYLLQSIYRLNSPPECASRLSKQSKHADPIAPLDWPIPASRQERGRTEFPRKDSTKSVEDLLVLRPVLLGLEDPSDSGLGLFHRRHHHHHGLLGPAVAVLHPVAVVVQVVVAVFERLEEVAAVVVVVFVEAVVVTWYGKQILYG